LVSATVAEADEAGAVGSRPPALAAEEIADEREEAHRHEAVLGEHEDHADDQVDVDAILLAERLLLDSGGVALLDGVHVDVGVTAQSCQNHDEGDAHPRHLLVPLLVVVVHALVVLEHLHDLRLLLRRLLRNDGRPAARLRG